MAQQYGYADKKPEITKRLKRAEGQVRGIARMVDEDKYCIDILTQISAIQAALDKVGLQLLSEHAKHCLTDPKIKNGKDFAVLASEVSEDPVSKAAGGDFGFVIDKANRDVNPVTVDALFKLKDGEYSGVINIGYALEIVKNVQTQPDGKIKTSHLIFKLQRHK